MNDRVPTSHDLNGYTRYDRIFMDTLAMINFNGNCNVNSCHEDDNADQIFVHLKLFAHFAQSKTAYKVAQKC